MAGGPIRQDPISYGIIALCVALLIYLAPLSLDIMAKSTFALVITVTGLVLSRRFGLETVDAEVSGKEGFQLIIYVFMSYAAIAAINLFGRSQFMLGLDLTGLSGVSLFLVPRAYGVLIAVAEETIFRGFFANLFITRLSPFGYFASAAFFTVYHIIAYSADPMALPIVFGAGFVLTYAAAKTRRISTSMTGHMINNFLSGV